MAQEMKPPLHRLCSWALVHRITRRIACWAFVHVVVRHAGVLSGPGRREHGRAFAERYPRRGDVQGQGHGRRLAVGPAATSFLPPGSRGAPTLPCDPGRDADVAAHVELVGLLVVAVERFSQLQTRSTPMPRPIVPLCERKGAADGAAESERGSRHPQRLS